MKEKILEFLEKSNIKFASKNDMILFFSGRFTKTPKEIKEIIERMLARGEIYEKRSGEEFKGKYNFKTMSDCEVIIPLYKTYGVDFLEKLSGIFAFALYDSEKVG